MSGNNQNLQSSVASYSDQSLTVSYTPPSNQQLLVYRASVYNATTTENSLGLFHSITNSQFKLYKQLSGVGTNFTTQIQTGTAVSIFNTTNNDGFIVQSKDPFNMFTFNVSQAQTGSPVFTYKYWNGSTFATLSMLNTPSYLNTGIKAAVFNAPTDWVVGSNGIADDTFYSVQVIATTAPSQAVQIDAIKVCKMLKMSFNVPQSALMTISFEDHPYLLQVGEAIIPFFSYTSSFNRIEIAYKINP